jgi:hypothetical protein
MPRYDIHFQPVMPTEDAQGYKIFTFGFTRTLGIRGPQALVNRWAKTFMTPKGSDLLHPSYGTEFGSLPGSNISNDFSMLQDVVVMAIEDASDQVRQQETRAAIPADEALSSAELSWIRPTAGGDGFDVGIIINNKAGRVLPLKLTLAATR